jgi:spore germination protein GerM
MRWWRTSLIAAVAIVAGCGVPTQDAAHRIDDDQVPLGLLEADTSAPAADTTEPALSTTTAAVYLVRDDRLVPVQRSVTELTPEDVIAALLAGPTPSEEADGLRSALEPAELVNSARRTGDNAQVDLAPAFTAGAAGEQRTALAQMTYSLTEIPGIAAVTFTLDGEPTNVPRADGSASTGPVRREDYQLLGPA